VAETTVTAYAPPITKRLVARLGKRSLPLLFNSRSTTPFHRPTDLSGSLSFCRRKPSVCKRTTQLWLFSSVTLFQQANFTAADTIHPHKPQIMKKKILPPVFAMITLLLTTASDAQTALGTANETGFVSNKGYWVVESNKHQPKESVIYFYNNDNLLVYRKEVKGRKLKVDRLKTKMELKTTLDDAVAAFENGVAKRQ
jgi:hypothetical protein